MNNAQIRIFDEVVPFSKETQKNTANALAAKVTEGDVDPVQFYATIKAMSETLNLFLKDKEVIETTVAACEKYGKAGAAFNGANLAVTEAGVRYDFSACEDPTWNDLAKKKAELDEKIKEREKFLKGISEHQTMIIEETGEVATIYAPVKTSATTVRVTFAK